jgi:methyl-accepting chemotaxis protein
MALLLAPPLAAEAGGQGRRQDIGVWRWSPADESSFATPSLDDQGWTEVKPASSLAPLPKDGSFWLRTRFSAEELAGFRTGPEGAKELYFLSGMAGCAFELYANGVWLGSRGKSRPVYDVRKTLSDAWLIPAGGGEGDLVLALRCTWPGTNLKLPVFQLGDAAAAAQELGAHNFWNGTFYVMLCALCVFLGLYFLVLFVFKTEARENLYFALSLLLLAFYFYEMGSAWLPLSGPYFTALARASLTASVMFLYCFFSTFFASARGRRFRPVAMVVALLAYLAFLAAAGKPDLGDLVFNLCLLPIVAVLVYGISASVASVRRGGVESIPLLVGMAIGSGFAIHDIYYQVLGRPPFAWLQGLTFFSLDAAIFVMLSMRQTRLSNEVAALARALDAGKREVETSLSRLVRAGDSVATIGRELEEAVSSASTSAERSEGRTAGVGAEAAHLAERAKEVEDLVSSLVASIGAVNDKLSEEASGIERTAAAAVELQAGIESSASIIDKTADFAEGLASLTDSGERSADALGGALARIAESAQGIGEVVDAVNEFAERTNLLAMNASIEAAHSGQAGKGFGVIAGEVKKLAAAQGERAGRISVFAKDIGARLGEGGRDADELRKSLRRIAQDARGAAARMAEAKAGALEQAQASSEVRAAMESLAGAVAAIRDEARRQSGYSEKVSEAVAAMATGAREARESAAAIAEEGREIARAMRNLRDLSVRSLSLTEEMQQVPDAEPAGR